MFSPFTANTPQLFVDIDRVKAQKLGVPIQNVTDTIQTYFGSTYVNDFNLFGRTYHVTAQADLPFRKETADLARLRTRNAAGDMVMLGSVVDFSDISGPDRVARYNLYPASELQGETLPGTSSATAIDTMKQLAERDAAERLFLRMDRPVLSAGHRRQYRPLCVPDLRAVRLLVLAAQYGSWSLPFAVILIVPMCLLAATIGVRIMGQDVNILTQIGFVVLVGLAAKNAILIVEFARDIELEGKPRLEAVIEACRLAAAADPDDVVRLHSRRAAAGDLDRLGLGNAPGGRRRRVLRHARRHAVRADLHADLLHGGPQSGRSSAPEDAGAETDSAAAIVLRNPAILLAYLK